jgi:hypothetical protein
MPRKNPLLPARIVWGGDVKPKEERTDEERALLQAAGAYLRSIGWVAAVANVARIQEQLPLSHHFELVIKFTGGKVRETVAQ